MTVEKMNIEDFFNDAYEDVQSLWDVEVRRRADEVRAGLVTLVPGEVVREQVRERIAALRNVRCCA